MNTQHAPAIDGTTHFFRCTHCDEPGTADDFEYQGSTSCPACGQTTPRLAAISRDEWILRSIAAILAADSDWGADTLDKIAGLLTEEGYNCTNETNDEDDEDEPTEIDEDEEGSAG